MVYKALSNFVSPVERQYQQIRQPSPPQPAPEAPTAPAPIELDAGEVGDILAHKRSASPAELEYLLKNAKRFNLSNRQRTDISIQLTVAMAYRGKPAPDLNAELFRQLDVADTPVGLLHHRSWFERELQTGAEAIACCRSHHPPKCQCWRGFRERFYLIRDRYGEKSPEMWAARNLWEFLERYEKGRPVAGLHDISERTIAQ